MNGKVLADICYSSGGFVARGGAPEGGALEDFAARPLSVLSPNGDGLFAYRSAAWRSCVGAREMHVIDAWRAPMEGAA